MAGAKAPCSQATSLPSCRTGVTSASCEVIQILFRLEPRQYDESSRESNHSHSIKSTAAGGERMSYPTLKSQWLAPPNAICGGSVVKRTPNSKATRGRARTPKACAKQSDHIRVISHEVLSECDASSHRFHVSWCPTNE